MKLKESWSRVNILLSKHQNLFLGILLMFFLIPLIILLWPVSPQTFVVSDDVIGTIEQSQIPVSTEVVSSTELTLHSDFNIDEFEMGQSPVRDKLLAMFDPKDPNTIFDIIDTIQADTVLSRNCHDIAHDLGHHAYELYGFSEAMTFNNPNHVKHALPQYICAGGYMHGILEQLSISQPDFLNTPDIICSSVPEADRASCFHGIGHVFMMQNERDAFSSIKDCRKISETTNMYRCFEGVRMEQFWGGKENGGEGELGWDIDKPLQPCIDAELDAKPTCFLYSPFGYLRSHPKDYSGAVRMCTQNNLPESDINFCLKGLGITMMSKFKGQNLQGSEVYVAELSSSQKQAFYEGVIGYALLSGVKKDELRNTCNLFINDTNICQNVLESLK